MRTIAARAALTQKVREELKESFKMDSHTRATMNAVTGTKINTLALNREIMAAHNTFFSNKIEAGKVTNQNKSGRCWLFAALNTLRPRLIKKYNLEDFEFSEIYLFFWDKMEKSNLFLECVIETKDKDLKDEKLKFILKEPFADGGQWNFVVALIEKYGLVPRYAMDETANSLDSSNMDTVMTSLLRHDAMILRNMHKEGKSEKELRKRKEEMLAELYRVLVICLGHPPETFEFIYEDKNKKTSIPRTFTPHDFYRKEIGGDLREYVTLFNDPTREYNKLYKILLDRNMIEKPDITFINLKIHDFKQYIIKSLLDNETVWFGADVLKECDRLLGVMATNLLDYETLFGIKLQKTKEERILHYESVPDHAMVFTGVDLKDGKPVKWLVENSWGKEPGKDGFYTMYDNWFDEYVYEAVVHNRYLPKKVRDLLDSRPVELPEDDVMR